MTTSEARVVRINETGPASVLKIGYETIDPNILKSIGELNNSPI